MARRAGLTLGLLALLAGAAAPDAGVGQPIDWGRLPSASQRLVEPVVARPQISRDVAHITYPSRREIWEYLLDYPDFAADVARALHEGKYRLRLVGDHPAGLLDLLAAEPRLNRERLAEFRGILLRRPLRRAADVG